MVADPVEAWLIPFGFFSPLKRKDTKDKDYLVYSYTFWALGC